MIEWDRQGSCAKWLNLSYIWMTLGKHCYILLLMCLLTSLNVIGKDTCSLRNEKDISNLKQNPHSCYMYSNTALLAAKSHRLAHVFCTHELWPGFSGNMLPKVVSHWVSLLFLSLHHRLNIITSVFIKWLQPPFFLWGCLKDYCVIFSSSMYEQGLTGLTVYHRGIGGGFLCFQKV